MTASSSPAPPKAFTLAGADPAFGSRTKNVFGSLGTIEAKHATFSSTRAGRDLDLIKPDPIDGDNLGQVSGAIHVGKGSQAVEGEFKVPTMRGAPQRSRGGNGFTRRVREAMREPCMNPENWKRYDLSEVTPGQMSERTIQTAALDFLQSIRHASEAEQWAESEDREPMESDGETASRHIFHRPVGKLSAEKSHSEKSSAEKSSAEKLSAEKLSAEKSSAKKVPADKLSPRKLPTAAGFVTSAWVEENEEEGADLAVAESTSISKTHAVKFTLTSSREPVSCESDLMGTSKLAADSMSMVNELTDAGMVGVTFKAVAASKHIRKRGSDEEEKEEEDRVEIRRPKHLKIREKFAVSTSTAAANRAAGSRDESNAMGCEGRNLSEGVANEFEDDWEELGALDDDEEEGPAENSDAFSF